MIRNVKQHLYLCVDAGGTFLKSALLDNNALLVEGSAYTAPACSQASEDEVWLAFRNVVLHGLAIAESRNKTLGGIGIAFPGPFDYRQATSLMKHKFPSLYGIDLRERLYEIPGISHNIPICFLHDAEAVIVGEMWKGRAQGFSNVAVVTLGTGLGFTYCINGAVQRNELGGPAISIFGWPYRDGILEDYVSRRGLLRMYSDFGGTLPIQDVADIGRGADNGDAVCIRCFHEVGEILAASLQPVLVEQEIQCLLFGGQISRSFKHIEEIITQELSTVKSLQVIDTVENMDTAAHAGALKTIFKYYLQHEKHTNIHSKHRLHEREHLYLEKSGNCIV